MEDQAPYLTDRKEHLLEDASRKSKKYELHSFTMKLEMVKARSLADFRIQNGKGRRRVGQPYAVLVITDKAITPYYDVIHPQTDVNELERFIEKGLVYTPERYLEGG